MIIMNSANCCIVHPMANKTGTHLSKSKSKKNKTNCQHKALVQQQILYFQENNKNTILF